MSSRQVLGLAAWTSLCAAILAGLGAATNDAVEASARRVEFAGVRQLLGAVAYDNDPTSDTLTVNDGGGDPRRVFRAYRAGAPVALVIESVAPGGYGGDIRLLIGVRADGAVLGAQVVEHNETPGLGDRMLPSQSDWLAGFQGKRLGRPPAARWAVKRDGGVFDQFTGATITPRAITAAVKSTLMFVERRHGELWQPGRPANGTAR